MFGRIALNAFNWRQHTEVQIIGGLEDTSYAHLNETTGTITDWNTYRQVTQNGVDITVWNRFSVECHALEGCDVDRLFLKPEHLITFRKGDKVVFQKAESSQSLPEDGTRGTLVRWSGTEWTVETEEEKRISHIRTRDLRKVEAKSLPKAKGGVYVYTAAEHEAFQKEETRAVKQVGVQSAEVTAQADSRALRKLAKRAERERAGTKARGGIKRGDTVIMSGFAKKHPAQQLLKLNGSEGTIDGKGEGDDCWNVQVDSYYGMVFPMIVKYTEDGELIANPGSQKKFTDLSLKW